MGFLNRLFSFFSHPDFEDIWRQFAEVKKGRYIGNVSDAVELDYKGVQILIEDYTDYRSVGVSVQQYEYTRCQVQFRSKSNLELVLVQEKLFEKVGKILGTKEIKTGDFDFDKKFLIKGNDEINIQIFLSDDLLRIQMRNLPIVRFEITDGEGLFQEKPAEGYYMVYLVLDGKIMGIDQLHKIYDLIVRVLDQLIKIGTI